MRLWLKSLGIGFTAAMLTFFLWDDIRRETIRKSYTSEFVVKASPLADTSIAFSFKRVMELTELRLRDLSYGYEIERLNDNVMKITITGMKDTITARHMLMSNGRLQLRELYNGSELSPMLTRASVWIDSVNRLSIPVTKERSGDSLSEAVSALLDSMESESPTVIEELDKKKLIAFSEPLVDPTSIFYLPAEIGYTRVHDTAKVRSLFNENSIRSLGPADATLCFGIAVKQPSLSKEFTIPLYFLRTYNRSRALLENGDVADAYSDFDSYGKPVVYFQFTPAASRTWQTMTRLNVQRSIAIIFSNLVISAPKVESEIAGGSCVINGNFSIDEARSLSQLIKSPLLPGNLQLISSITKIETDSKEHDKKMLATIAVFIVFSLLCSIILNTLKIN
jgi:SecD/SecF fusion protein